MAHESRTFYEVLGIPQEADVSEVRAAWRREVREWHPDQFSEGNRGDAERRAQAINEAYATLRDPMRRERYDARLAYHAAAAAAARPTAEPRRDARLHARRSRERDVRTAPEPVSVSSFVRDVKTASQRHPNFAVAAAVMWLVIIAGTVMLYTSRPPEPGASIHTGTPVVDAQPDLDVLAEELAPDDALEDFAADDSSLPLNAAPHRRSRSTTPGKVVTIMPTG